LEAITYLLQRGANIDALNEKEAQTPLHWACIGKSLPVHVEQVFRVDAVLHSQRVALCAHSLISDIIWSRCGSQSMLLLIKEGADITKSDKRGYDCLVHACQYGNVLMAHNLIVKQGT
jgi:hypothetical protein